MAGRRAAALGVLALLAAGCGSSAKTNAPRTWTGPPGVVRIGVAHLLWPLDPARARGRDEIALARTLFATPLRTAPTTGALRPGLCSTWSSPDGSRTWRLRCRHAAAIARALRRARLIPGATIAAGAGALEITAPRPDPELPYALTEVAAAPAGVPGPFRLVSASPQKVVAERGGVRLVFRKLDPHAAQRLFRQGRLDEAPVPLGDLQADLRNRALAPAVRVRRLLAVDLVEATRGGVLARLPGLRRVYGATADRADYQALVPEFEAPPAFHLERPPSEKKVARAPVVATRAAKRMIGARPRAAVRFAEPSDPDLAYGAGLLIAAWQDLGLGPFVGRGRPDARFERVLAPYPRLAALGAAVRGRQVIPIAWAVDARLVSPRLRGWREDDLGVVDYARVRPLARTRSR
ncbi:MAG TPA: hypothetical protein VLU96_03260 [Gaiellaceae bacterium]|nr:hypothetical protein [Gaiellaceae bacterium]